MKFKLTSKVPGFKGTCKPTWLNTNQVYNRFDDGITGFFRLVNRFGFKTGDVFHGIIKSDRCVYSTSDEDRE